MPRTIQRFEVSLKAFIMRDTRVLLVREADTGYWELPGGRIDVGEEWEPHDAILAREIAEELGAAFQIDIGTKTVTWTRRRPSDGVFQFIVARACRHIAGEPLLSDEHNQLAWLAPNEWRNMELPPESGYAAALDQLWERSQL